MGSVEVESGGNNYCMDRTLPSERAPLQGLGTLGTAPPPVDSGSRDARDDDSSLRRILLGISNTCCPVAVNSFVGGGESDESHQIILGIMVNMT